MANTVVVKMKAARITPANVGVNAETVELEEVFDSDVAKSNVRSAAVDQGSNPKMEFRLNLTSAVAKGQFKNDQAYVVSFTETT